MVSPGEVARDGALAALGERHRARPQHQLRQPAARAAAQHRAARDRSRAGPRHATVRHPHARAAAPERAAEGDATGYTPLPTAKAKGWRVDVGEYPRAIAWGNGAAELAVATAAGVVRGAARQRRHPILRRKVHEAPITSMAWQPAQARIATAGEDGAVRILQLGADEPAITVVRPGRRPIDSSSPGAPRATCWRSRRATPGFIFGADGKQMRRHPRRRQHDHRPHLVAGRRRDRVLVLRRRARDRSQDGRAPAAPGRARDRC